MAQKFNPLSGEFDIVNTKLSKLSGITAWRVPYIGADLKVAEDADLTFDGTNLSIVAPTSDLHAATKKYVDDEVGSIDLSHTGEVTGTSQILTLDKTAISNQSDVTITAADTIIYGDATDSNNLKKDTVQGILDLVPATTPAGNNTEIQYNDNGSFGASSSFTYDTSTEALTFNVGIYLPKTNQNNLPQGVIYKGGTPWIHDFTSTNAFFGNNLFIGENCGNFTMSGSIPTGAGNNTMLGTSAFTSNISGYGNTGFGQNTLESNTSGDNNVAVGKFALWTITTGNDNLGFGYAAGERRADLQFNTDSDNCIFIGKQSGCSVAGAYNEVAIGYYSQGVGDNSIVLGSNAIKTVKTVIWGDVGCSIESPTAKLHVLGLASANVVEKTQGASSQSGDLKQYLKSDDTLYSGTNSIGERFQTDSVKNWFGTGKDSSIYYDGSDMYIESQEVGSGDLILNSGGGNVGIGTTSPNSTLDVTGSVTMSYVEKTANYTLTASDYTVNCTANTFTITLPTAVGITGRIYNIKNTGTGTITVDGNASETIDGSVTEDLIQDEVITIQSTGSNWIII